MTARVKECTSFLHLCFSGHGPLANPVALRLEGADNPNITQTCAHCFCDTALQIQSVPPLSKNKQDWFLLTCRTLGLYISLLFSISFSPCLCHFQFPSLCLSLFLCLLQYLIFTDVLCIYLLDTVCTLPADTVDYLIYIKYVGCMYKLYVYSKYL